MNYPIYVTVQVSGNRLVSKKDITDRKNVTTQTFTCINIADRQDRNVCTYNSVFLSKKLCGLQTGRHRTTTFAMYSAHP